MEQARFNRIFYVVPSSPHGALWGGVGVLLKTSALRDSYSVLGYADPLPFALILLLIVHVKIVHSLVVLGDLDYLIGIDCFLLHDIAQISKSCRVTEIFQ